MKFYKQAKNMTQATRITCDIYVCDQYVWHKTSSNIFSLEILMMHLALKNSMKSFRVDTLTDMISMMNKHRLQNSFKPEDWMELKNNVMFECYII